MMTLTDTPPTGLVDLTSKLHLNRPKPCVHTPSEPDQYSGFLTILHQLILNKVPEIIDVG